MLTLGAIASASFLSVRANDGAAVDGIPVPRDISDDVPIGTLRSTDAVPTGGGEDNASILIESAGVPPTLASSLPMVEKLQ
jgi:hypothetical protein